MNSYAVKRLDLHVDESGLDPSDGRLLRDQLLVIGIDSEQGRVGNSIDLATGSQKIVSLDLPGFMAERLVQFYERFFVDPDPSDWRNCHRFAIWMTAGELVEDPRYPKGLCASDDPRIEDIARNGVAFEGRIPVGTHAVLVRPGWAGLGVGQIAHSMVGLGQAQPEGQQCIQVTNIRGGMTLSSSRVDRDKMRRQRGDYHWQTRMLVSNA